MFGRRYFGGRYYAPRYFGCGGDGGPVDLTASTGDWTAPNRLTSFDSMARKTSYQIDNRKTSWDAKDRD